jgi:SAM-dependent methyltransferase
MQVDEATRIRRAQTFDEIAELYDRGRPESPPHIFAETLAAAGIDAAVANVLEIGCGTGQATLPLARLGCRVVAIEMGSNLARIAVRKLAGFRRVAVVNARFEDWQPGGERFDIVFAVSSWHWLDPQTRYARAASLLKPGGVLAFTWTGHVFPPDSDPFFQAIQSSYKALGVAGMDWPPPPPDEIPDSRNEIEQSGYFTDVRVTRHILVDEFTANQYIALMSTASDHRLMEQAKRESLFAEMRRLIDDRPGGRIRKHNLVLLHLAYRKP